MSLEPGTAVAGGAGPDSARTRGEGLQEGLIGRLRAGVAAAAEEVERTRGKCRRIRNRRQRDVARARARAVGELVTTDVGAVRARVDDLDELVGGGRGGAGRELVDAKARRALACDAGEDRVRRAVVAQLHGAVVPVGPAGDPVQPLERIDGARIALRALRTPLALGPGWPLRALRSRRSVRARGPAGSSRPRRAGRALGPSHAPGDPPLVLAARALRDAPEGRLEQVAIGLGARVGNVLLIAVLAWLILAARGAPLGDELVLELGLVGAFGLGFVALARRPSEVVLGYKG